MELEANRWPVDQALISTHRSRGWRSVAAVTFFCLLFSCIVVECYRNQEHFPKVATVLNAVDPKQFFQYTGENAQGPPPSQPINLQLLPSWEAKSYSTSAGLSPGAALPNRPFGPRQRIADALRIYDSVLGLDNPQLISGLPHGLRDVIIKSVEAASKIRQNLVTSNTALWQAHGRHTQRGGAVTAAVQGLAGANGGLNDDSLPLENEFQNNLVRGQVPAAVLRQNAQANLNYGANLQSSSYQEFDEQLPERHLDAVPISGHLASWQSAQRLADDSTSSGLFRPHPHTDMEIFKRDLATLILLFLAICLLGAIFGIIRLLLACCSSKQKGDQKATQPLETANIGKLGDAGNATAATPVTRNPLALVSQSLFQAAAQLVGAGPPEPEAFDVAISLYSRGAGEDGADVARLEAARALQAWLLEQGFTATICCCGPDTPPATAAALEDLVLRARLFVVLGDNAWARCDGCVRLLSLALGGNQLHARPSIYVLCARDFAYREGLAVGHFRLGPGNSGSLDGAAGRSAAWEALRPHLPRGGGGAGGGGSVGGRLAAADVAAARAAAADIEGRLSGQLRALSAAGSPRTAQTAAAAVIAPTFTRPPIRFEYNPWTDARR